jgi:hypothetical protein
MFCSTWAGVRAARSCPVQWLPLFLAVAKMTIVVGIWDVLCYIAGVTSCSIC